MADQSIIKVKCKGLKKNYSPDGYEIGDVVYRKYTKTFYFHVPYKRKHLTGGPRPMRKEMPYHLWLLLEDQIKKACKPLSNISDKVDNTRPMLSSLILHVDQWTGEIVNYEMEDIKEVKAKVKAASKTYDKHEFFGMFQLHIKQD